jgi:hypothetical protein
VDVPHQHHQHSLPKKNNVSVINIDIGTTIQQLLLPMYGDAYASNGHALHQGQQRSKESGHSFYLRIDGGFQDLELLSLVQLPLLKVGSVIKS